METARLKLTLQYAGQNYGGWQYQPAQGEPKLPSVQGMVVQALQQVVGQGPLRPAELIVAGRTDAGVHAWGQVAHMDLPAALQARPAHSWVEGLNHFLPPSIRVLAAEFVPPSFHARHSARARHYCYRLWTGRQLRPDLVGVVGHLPAPHGQPLALAAVQAAVASLPVGMATDFTSLRDAECQAKSPICTLTHAAWQEAEPELWHLEVRADRFLHHMVRNLMGTLAEVALGKRDADLRVLLAQRDRRQAGPTFSPAGLVLVGVQYPAASTT